MPSPVRLGRFGPTCVDTDTRYKMGIDLVETRYNSVKLGELGKLGESNKIESLGTKETKKLKKKSTFKIPLKSQNTRDLISITTIRIQKN